MASFLPEERARAFPPAAMTGAQRELRVLFSSAGRRVELMQCFQREALSLGIQLRTLGCDLKPQLSPACRLADGMFAVPAATDRDFIPEMLRLAAAHRVTAIIPTIDPELLPLSLARERFAAIGTDIVISGPGLIAIASDKLRTFEFLKANAIPTPRTTSLAAARADPTGWSWPVIVKPRYGSASRGIRIVNSAAGLPAESDEPMIVQELIRGQEYTVNMFFDRAGTLRAAVPHERLQVRAGEVEKGTTRRDEALVDLAWTLASTLRAARGAMCFQAFLSDRKDLYVIEINARFGGGYPLTHHAGAKFAKWLLEEEAGLPSTASNDGWRENLTMLRYDSAVFVQP